MPHFGCLSFSVWVTSYHRMCSGDICVAECVRRSFHLKAQEYPYVTFAEPGPVGGRLGWSHLLATVRMLPRVFFMVDRPYFVLCAQKWAGASKSILKFLRSFTPSNSSLLISNLLHLRLDHCCFSRKSCEPLCKQIPLPHATSNNP